MASVKIAGKSKVVILLHNCTMCSTIYIKGGVNMIATSFSAVRQKFKDFCDKATNDFETIIITRERGENVVMMSEAEYNNLLENLYVRSNPTYYNELLKSIEQLKINKGQKRELIDE